jgi:SAM-dependent methyltransferase
MMPSETIHRLSNPLRVGWDLLRGRSLLRACFMQSLHRLDHGLSGTVVDLGSKVRNASYLECFHLAPGTDVVATDLHAAAGVVQVDVEQPLPFTDGSLDAILAFNLFEHVWNIDRIAGEAFRCLKPGGRVYIEIPFLYEFHADPSDWRRLTDRAIVRWWDGAGFATEHVEALGDGPVSALATRLPAFLLPPLPGLRSSATALGYTLALPWDLLLAIRPMRPVRRIPISFAQGYLAVFRKPG